MKFKTKTAAICQSLLSGGSLSIMDGFKQFGVTNLPREISRSIEKKFGVHVIRIKCTSKTPYGHTNVFYKYQLVPNKGNLLNQRAGIGRMIQYVMDNVVKKRK